MSCKVFCIGLGRPECVLVEKGYVMNRGTLYSALSLAIGEEFFPQCHDVLMARKWLRQSAGVNGGLILRAAGELLKAAAEYWEISGGNTVAWRRQFEDLADCLDMQNDPASDRLAEAIQRITSQDRMSSDNTIELFVILSGLTFKLGMAVREGVMEVRAGTFGLDRT